MAEFKTSKKVKLEEGTHPKDVLIYVKEDSITREPNVFTSSADDTDSNDLISLVNLPSIVLQNEMRADGTFFPVTNRADYHNSGAFTPTDGSLLSSEYIASLGSRNVIEMHDHRVNMTPGSHIESLVNHFHTLGINRGFSNWKNNASFGIAELITDGRHANGKKMHTTNPDVERYRKCFGLSPTVHSGFFTYAYWVKLIESPVDSIGIGMNATFINGERVYNVPGSRPEDIGAHHLITEPGDWVHVVQHAKVYLDYHFSDIGIIFADRGVDPANPPVNKMLFALPYLARGLVNITPDMHVNPLGTEVPMFRGVL